ncbi:hypothetical protein DMB66_21235 [Actinoplanes sp. ATCC 53533]|uniref:hypothetical protein n=1 Tax=Actinoplanes sp. ATCC 53533 TaxID=1288362 RepID=UPI000F771F3F|nr:hypothetical protein [Actinoplanes sp. ATCC 53533]RSM64039.1 hypothetical protein DMB66_21235 [Actinoplanes sp. ATCC 53533]
MSTTDPHEEGSQADERGSQMGLFAEILDEYTTFVFAAAGPHPTSASIIAAIGWLGAIPSPPDDWRFGTEHTPIQPWYLRQVHADGRAARANVPIQTLTTPGE